MNQGFSCKKLHKISLKYFGRGNKNLSVCRDRVETMTIWTVRNFFISRVKTFFYEKISHDTVFTMCSVH